MKQAYRFDDNGYYVEPVLVEGELPSDCTDVPLPQPNWKPKWNGTEWVETITQEELDEPEESSGVLTSEERIAELEILVAELVFKDMFGG